MQEEKQIMNKDVNAGEKVIALIAEKMKGKKEVMQMGVGDLSPYRE